MHVAAGAGKGGEVLCIDIDQTTIHETAPGDDRVAVVDLLVCPEVGIVMTDVGSQLLKGAGVQESLNPLLGGKLVAAVLLLYRSLATSEEHLLPSLDECPDLLCLYTHYIYVRLHYLPIPDKGTGIHAYPQKRSRVHFTRNVSGPI